MSRIIILILLHVIADYFLQGSKLSKLKALKLSYLFEHVAIYTGIFIVFSPLLLGLTIVEGVIFSLINGAAHFVVDFIIGKLKLKYHDTNESAYLSVVGADHTIHIIILILTYIYMFPNAINAAYLLN
ncbi:MAG: DUF3307 domain-containing protein [Paludibacter sp.]|nr:DUF3307 domain-containing protein [Paludibacter sp.]